MEFCGDKNQGDAEGLQPDNVHLKLGNVVQLQGHQLISKFPTFKLQIHMESNDVVLACAWVLFESHRSIEDCTSL